MSTAVIIPVRNRPDLVRAAIQSSMDQTQPVDEIIVIDDASTDETPDVVMRMAVEDSRIRLIRLETNRGASNARNVGAAATSADLLAFLDSDDQWLPDKHELQLRVLRENEGAVASFTGIRYMLPNGWKDEPLLPDIFLDDLRRMNFLGSTSTALVRRNAFEAIKGFDTSLPSCQDWDLWLRLRRLGPFALVCEPKILYNQTDSGRISKNLNRVSIGHQIVFERATKDLRGLDLRKVRAYHHVRMSQILLWDFAAPRAAMIAAIRSLTNWPTRMGGHLFLWALRSLVSRA